MDELILQTYRFLDSFDSKHKLLGVKKEVFNFLVSLEIIKDYAVIGIFLSIIMFIFKRK